MTQDIVEAIACKLAGRHRIKAAIFRACRRHEEFCEDCGTLAPQAVFKGAPRFVIWAQFDANPDVEYVTWTD